MLGRGVRLAFAHARQGERASVQSEVQRLGLRDAALLERYRAKLKLREPAPAASTPR